jgi:hypothetical protein
MDPNSQNQRWSKWWFRLGHRGAGFSKLVTIAEIESNFRRFLAKLFRSTVGAMGFERKGGRLTVWVLIEGEHITPHDPTYRKYIRDTATAFFVAGFGPNTVVAVTAKLMAGSAQDGKPSEQMLILPTINFRELLTAENPETEHGPVRIIRTSREVSL